MNYIFLGLSIVSLIVFILLLVTMISFILEGDFEFDLLLSVLTLELMALFAFILCFIAIKKDILYEETQTYIVQENKDISIPYKYKIEEITIKEYRNKYWEKNDWIESSQHFKREEKVIYSNELPNGKYTFMEQEK